MMYVVDGNLTYGNSAIKATVGRAVAYSCVQKAVFSLVFPQFINIALTNRRKIKFCLIMYAMITGKNSAF